MKLFAAISALALVFAASAPVNAAPGGPIDTMQLGSYVCELPGNVSGPAGIRVPDRDFTILNASSYMAGGKRGTYLLTGNRLTMTTGPMRGQAFHRHSASFLREIIPGGQVGRLRCIRRNGNLD